MAKATTAEVVKAILETGIDSWNVDFSGGRDAWPKPGRLSGFIEYEAGDSWLSLRIQGEGRKIAGDGRQHDVTVELVAAVATVDDAPLGVA